MAGIIKGFRWSILGPRVALDLQLVTVSVVIAGACLAARVWYFRRMERSVADVI